MSKRYEPDAEFVDRLEWQLASEFRRREHLKPASGRIAVPKSVAVISLAAGVLLLGVAATKAADIIKDSWRKKIEVARLETEVKIKTAFLGLKKDRAAQAQNQYSVGLVSEDEALAARLDEDRASADLEKSALDLAEAKVSGQAPRDELYAPLAGGRDFVGERLALEKKTIEVALKLRRDRVGPTLRHRFELGLVPKRDLSEFEAALAAQEATIGDIESRLALRKKYLSGEISTAELEIRTRMSAAEKDLREARSSIEIIRPRLEDLRAKAAAGLVGPDALRSAELGLSAIEARADLALKEIEILKQLK